MLDIHFIREHVEEVEESIKRRRLSEEIDVQHLLTLDDERKALLQQAEDLRRERNELSAAIPQLPEAERTSAVTRVKALKGELSNIESSLATVTEQWQALLRDVPNILSPEVPSGADDTENKVLRTWGKPSDFSFAPKDHVELGESLGILDFESGTAVAGSKFYFLKNDAVLLQLALQQYALEILLAEGFTPMYSPVLAKQEILQGAGYNPRGPEKQIYNVEDEGLSMIATSEITLNGAFAERVFAEEELPVKLVGISECYRREAGSWGRFSKGLYRVHHFLKVEMFIFCTPSTSGEMHEYLLDLEEKLYQGLEIPYRVVDICDGDLGAMAYRKFDLEAWMPGRDGGAYGEITSCSNCTDYQARRMRIQYQDADGKKHLVHTLNGTAIALSRTPIAILENFQQEDGSVIIPSVLRKWMGGRERIVCQNL